MKLETKFFGEIEVNELEIINFNRGIPGFENEHQFMILKQNAESPFFILQAVTNPQLALIMIDLEQVVPGFSVELPDEIVVELKLTKPEDAVAYAIVVLPADISQATVNLAAPVIINIKEKQGKQVILNNPAYSIKHPLFSKVNGEVGLKTVSK